LSGSHSQSRSRQTLATNQLLGPKRRLQRSTGGDHTQRDAHVGVVLVGQVVRVDDLRAGHAKDLGEIPEHGLGSGVFHGRARVIQQELRRVFADEGGLFLLHAAHRLHLCVAVRLVFEVTGAARAIADDDTVNQRSLCRKALQDTVRRHELQIVVVSTNAEVRRARTARARARADPGRRLRR